MEKWLQNFARTSFLRSADTAHDLKTPLNVAVLNLELLRMRIRKLTDAGDDPKVIEYTAAIELELRRLALIFDTFFLLSTPPKGDGPPAMIDIAPICLETAAAASLPINVPAPAPIVRLAHEARISQAFRLFFETAAQLFPALEAAVTSENDTLTVTIVAAKPSEDFEPSRIFKFYYTDASGSPDLSMATARLVFETYGGELNVMEESDKVMIRLRFPPGEE